MYKNFDLALISLKKSNFRSKFHLKTAEKEYYLKNGDEKIRSHAFDFIQKRLAPAEIFNDGKQTPMRGHPVFIAQHATATCCRSCLFKWHGIKKGVILSDVEIEYIVNLIMLWIKDEMGN